MESLNKVISSFNLQNTLQPKIWLGENQKMNPKVRENLLEIAYQFIDSFGLRSEEHTSELQSHSI
jgi:hypothetical protein